MSETAVPEVTIKNSVSISCSPAAAFAYVSDITTHPDWSVDNIRVESRPEGKIAIGSRYRTVGHSVVRQGDQEAEIEVTVLEPPRRFEFIARSGPREFQHLFTFEEGADGTIVERVMTFIPDAVARDRMQQISGLIAEHNRASLALLKEQLERSG